MLSFLAPLVIEPKLVCALPIDNRSSGATVAAIFWQSPFREAFKHHIAEIGRGRYKQHWQVTPRT
jgi:hypothetical protein